MKRLGYATELKKLYEKNYKYFPCLFQDANRCQNEFRMNDEIGNIVGMKKEHFEIGQTFQTLENPCWKYVKVKSNVKTDQICVLASLNIDKVIENEVDPFFHRSVIQDC